ncbi:MAG: class I SAM-dependent methyltransferase [Eubacteriales bacterium]|nr:class I SAM-dependent methyltransferase [Eubacteriales bacterium]
MKLNGRLKMIADYIPQCITLADVGTDHAYIPIYAAKNGLCEKALAADLRAGPLKIASNNIKKYGLTERIETRLGDGLKPILLDESDVIVIAGMGGSLIRDILATSIEKAKRASVLLLQPNKAAEALRMWLYENGFIIEQEHLTRDAGKLYVLIKAKWSSYPVIKDVFTYFIGEEIFEGNEDHLESYLKKKLRELEVIIEGRSRSDPSKDRSIEEESGMSTETCVLIRDRLIELLKSV